MTSAHPRPRYGVNVLREKVHAALRAHDPKRTGPAAQCDNLTQATFLMLTAGMSVKGIAAVLERTPEYVRVMRRKLTLQMGVAPKRERKEKSSPATKAERKILAGIPDLPIEELARLSTQLRAGLLEMFTPAELRRLGIDVAPELQNRGRS